jgi:hypothetical protein
MLGLAFAKEIYIQGVVEAQGHPYPDSHESVPRGLKKRGLDMGEFLLILFNGF